MQDIFRYKQEGIDENGRAFGQFEATGVRPTFMTQLESAGVRLPASAFRQRDRCWKIKRSSRAERCSRNAVYLATDDCYVTTVDHRSPRSSASPAWWAAWRRSSCAATARRDVEDRLDVLTGSAPASRQGTRRAEHAAVAAAERRAELSMEEFVKRLVNLRPCCSSRPTRRSRRPSSSSSRRHGRGGDGCSCRLGRRAAGAGCRCGSLWRLLPLVVAAVASASGGCRSSPSSCPTRWS